MDVRDGAVEVLTDLVHGRRMAFCNNASVAADGTISEPLKVARFLERVAARALDRHPRDSASFEPRHHVLAFAGLLAQLLLRPSKAVTECADASSDLEVSQLTAPSAIAVGDTIDVTWQNGVASTITSAWPW